jgi:Ca2+-binding EF-hand superfamily protein
MKPTLFLSAFLIACGTSPSFSQESVFILPFVPVEKEIPADDEAGEDEATDEEEGDQDDVPELIEDPGPDDWFPGGWNPDWVKRGDDSNVIFYTMGGVDDDPVLYPYDEVIEIDPVIYQTGVPAAPKQSRKAKKAALAADIANGCAVTFGKLDADDSGSLDAYEFSVRRPGAAKANAKAFRRADKNRNGLLSLAEFKNKGSVPLVMPASLDVFEAYDARLSFNALDFDGNGFLTFGEFTAVLRPSGPGVLEAIFAEADRNGDGKISFAEYTHRQVRPAGVE